MKVLPTIILAIFLCGYVFAADPACKVFRCGGIDQSGEGPKLCVQFPEGDTNNGNTRKCDGDDNHCQAWTWTDPSKATTTAACGTNAPPQTFPTPWEGVKDVGLDKDYCEDNTHCRNNGDADNPAKCTDNVCVAGRVEGGDCADDRDAPFNMRCDGNKIAARVADGQKCTATAECLYGSMCATKDGEADALCVKSLSFDDGQIFTLTDATGMAKDGIVRPLIDICKTQSALRTDDQTEQWQCRGATKNGDDSVSGLSRDTLGAKCIVSAYNNPDTAKSGEVNDQAEVGVTSMCGFNRDEKAYCPIQFGDAKPNKAITDATNQALGLECHPMSGQDADNPKGTV